MATSSLFSLKLSYVRPQRSSRATAMHGAKFQSMPVPAISRAVTRETVSTSSGLREQPRPMWCGKIVAPLTAPWPWTASTP